MVELNALTFSCLKNNNILFVIFNLNHNYFLNTPLSRIYKVIYSTIPPTHTHVGESALGRSASTNRIRSNIYTHFLSVEQKRSNFHINAVEHAHSILDCLRLQKIEKATCLGRTLTQT